jgi:lipid II:glycine glycyltransferase (peptidoglycan interpeptide bridge formation enzyme)
VKVSRITDQRAWDERLRETGGHPLQAWAWGSLKEQFGWQAHRLWINDGQAAAQLLIRPFRGLAAGYVPRGPLLSAEPDIDRRLVRAMASVARSARSAFLRLEPDVLEGSPGQQALVASLEGQRFGQVERTLQPRSSIRLDLGRPDWQPLAGVSKGHRACVRSAERDGVSVRVASSEDEVDSLHAMLRESAARKHFGIHTAAYYRALWRLYGDDARLFLAVHESEVIAASLIVAFGSQAIYLAAGATARGLELRASHLLQSRALAWAHERGAQTYDLWGIPDARGRLALATEAVERQATGDRAALEAEAARDPLDGVYRFKKGWGGQVVRMVPAYDRVFIAPAYWFWRWRRADSLR